MNSCPGKEQTCLAIPVFSCIRQPGFPKDPSPPFVFPQRGKTSLSPQVSLALEVLVRQLPDSRKAWFPLCFKGEFAGGGRRRARVAGIENRRCRTKTSRPPCPFDLRSAFQDPWNPSSSILQNPGIANGVYSFDFAAARE